MLKSEDFAQVKMLRKSVTEFSGAVEGLSKDISKISNSENVYCDGLGVRSVPPLTVLRDVSNGSGFGSDSALFWIENQRVYYGGYPIDGLYLTEGEKKVISFGGYLLIFPDGVYVSLSDTTKYGNLHASLGTGGSAELKNCLSDLTPIESFSVLEEEPDNASAGDFRMVSTDDGYKMLRYDGNTWQDRDTFIRITLSGADTVFSAGDVVESNIIDKNCLKRFKISHISGDHIYLPGCTSDVSVNDITLTRYFPIMDNVTVSNGRLCGYRKGVDRSGKTVCRFYASGDGKPFDFCPNDPGESVWADISMSGDIMGIAEFDGSTVIFSEGKIIEIAVSSGRVIKSEIPCEGIAYGAEKSAASISNVLYFKGENTIFAYNGGSVKNISAELGGLKNSENGSPAAAYNGKYYVCAEMKDKKVMLCYDTVEHFWSVSSDIGISEFTVRRGILYALVKGESGSDKIIIIDAPSNTSSELYCTDGVDREDQVTEWSFESGMIGFEDLKGVYPEFITVRMEKCIGNAMVGVICDFDTEPCEMIKLPSRAGVYTVPLKKRRCDTVRVRMSGEGEFSMLGFMLGYTSELEAR